MYAHSISFLFTFTEKKKLSQDIIAWLLLYVVCFSLEQCAVLMVQLRDKSFDLLFFYSSLLFPLRIYVGYSTLFRRPWGLNWKCCVEFFSFSRLIFRVLSIDMILNSLMITFYASLCVKWTPSWPQKKNITMNNIFSHLLLSFHLYATLISG